MLKFGNLVIMATVLQGETFKGLLGHGEHEWTNINLTGCSEERRLAWFVTHMLTDSSVFYHEMKKKKTQTPSLDTSTTLSGFKTPELRKEKQFFSFLYTLLSIKYRWKWTKSLCETVFCVLGAQ